MKQLSDRVILKIESYISLIGILVVSMPNRYFPFNHFISFSILCLFLALVSLYALLRKPVVEQTVDVPEVAEEERRKCRRFLKFNFSVALFISIASLCFYFSL
ncbi:MAG: hypothetical protein GX416_12790 [Bacteroidales bacterium]|nr:hypothetical protein [Bacteroidales bacterium]